MGLDAGKIRRLAKKQGWSLQNLSEVSGIKSAVLSRMLTQGKFDAIHLMRLGDVLNVEPKSLLTKRKEPK